MTPRLAFQFSLEHLRVHKGTILADCVLGLFLLTVFFLGGSALSAMAQIAVE